MSVGTYIGYGITFILGLASGTAIEMLHFRYERLKDNWNDLKNPLQNVYEVIRNMRNDSDHAFRVQNSSKLGIDPEIERISHSLMDYLNWFKNFEGNMGIAKVDSIDEELGAALKGISYYAIFSKQDQKYIETRLFSFINITSSAERRLQEFAKARIPHYMLFGKRKLKNWRNSQF